MKAGTLFRAWMYAEIGFVAYMLLKPKSKDPSPSEQTLEALKAELEKKAEEIINAAKNPEATTTGSGSGTDVAQGPEDAR